MQLNLKKLIGNSNVWLYKDKMYTDRLEMKSKYHTDKCLLFTVEQFSMFNDETEIKGSTAIIRSKRTKLEIPGQVIDNPIFPDFSGEDFKVDLSWISEFNPSSKEFFIGETFCATPSTNCITYIKQKNKKTAVISAEFIDVCKQVEKFKILKGQSSISLIAKDFKMLFPAISSDISFASIESILSNEEAVGSVLVPDETMRAISKLPSKTEQIRFIDNKAVVQSTTMMFSGEVKTKGTVDATVLLAFLETSMPKFLVTNNAIKYKLTDKIYRIIPLAG